MSRDYIPDPEDATPEEQRRVELGRSMFLNRVTRDFIPTDPDYTGPEPPLGRQKAQEEALLAAEARTKSSRTRDMVNAEKAMKTMTVSQALDFIGEAPSYVAELHLLAEERTQGRKGILDYFPRVGRKMRAKYDKLPDKE